MRIAVLVLIVVAAITGCASDDRSTAEPTQTTATTEASATMSRELAPALTGTTVAGDAIALGDFRGRPVLVNVWSSW